MKDIVSCTSAVSTIEEALTQQTLSTEETLILHLWSDKGTEMFVTLAESAIDYMKDLFNENRVLTNQLPSVPETEGPTGT